MRCQVWSTPSHGRSCAPSHTRRMKEAWAAPEIARSRCRCGRAPDLLAPPLGVPAKPRVDPAHGWARSPRARERTAPRCREHERRAPVGPAVLAATDLPRPAVCPGGATLAPWKPLLIGVAAHRHGPEQDDNSLHQAKLPSGRTSVTFSSECGRPSRSRRSSLHRTHTPASRSPTIGSHCWPSMRPSSKVHC